MLVVLLVYQSPIVMLTCDVFVPRGRCMWEGVLAAAQGHWWWKLWIVKSIVHCLSPPALKSSACMKSGQSCSLQRSFPQIFLYSPSWTQQFEPTVGSIPQADLAVCLQHFLVFVLVKLSNHLCFRIISPGKQMHFFFYCLEVCELLRGKCRRGSQGKVVVEIKDKVLFEVLGCRELSLHQGIHLYPQVHNCWWWEKVRRLKSNHSNVT